MTDEIRMIAERLAKCDAAWRWAADEDDLFKAVEGAKRLADLILAEPIIVGSTPPCPVCGGSDWRPTDYADRGRRISVRCVACRGTGRTAMAGQATQHGE